MFGLHAKLAGEYTITRRKGTGEIVETLGPFKNLITNVGLDSLGVESGNNSAGVYSCFVGTSNTPPSTSDTTMGTRVATSNTPTITYNITRSPDYKVNVSYLYRFNQGDAAGNLTEVGVGKASSSGRPGGTFLLLFSRALIVDSGGNPTTITVLSDEFLDVTYTLSYTISTAISAPYNITDASTGITHTLQSRLCDDGTAFVYHSGALWPSDTARPFICVTQNTSGVPINFSATTSGSFVGGTQSGSAADVVRSAYVPGSYVSEMQGTVALGVANEGYGVGAILAARPTSSLSMIGITTGVLISPPIIKTATKTLRIKWKISWSR